MAQTVLSFQNLTSAQTSVIKDAPGTMLSAAIGPCVAGATLEVYDNASAGSGTFLTPNNVAAPAGAATFPSGRASDPTRSTGFLVNYGQQTVNGITVVTLGIAQLIVEYE